MRWATMGISLHRRSRAWKEEETTASKAGLPEDSGQVLEASGQVLEASRQVLGDSEEVLEASTRASVGGNPYPRDPPVQLNGPDAAGY